MDVFTIKGSVKKDVFGKLSEDKLGLLKKGGFPGELLTHCRVLLRLDWQTRAPRGLQDPTVLRWVTHPRTLDLLWRSGDESNWGADLRPKGRLLRKDCLCESHTSPGVGLSWAWKQKAEIIIEAVSALPRVWLESASPKLSRLPMVTTPLSAGGMHAPMQAPPLYILVLMCACVYKLESNFERSLLEITVVSGML